MADRDMNKSQPRATRELVEKSLRARHARERRFQAYGIGAILVSVAFVVLFFVSIIVQGSGAFTQTYVQVDIQFDAGVIDPAGTRDPQTLSSADYKKLVKNALLKSFPDVSGRKEKRALYGLVSNGATYELREEVMNNPDLIGQARSFWFPAAAEVDLFYRGKIDRTLPEKDRRLKDQQIAWIDQIDAEGRLEKRFNTIFFTAGDSRDPELAGIWGAAKGSFFMLLITMCLAFPLGVAAAIYLEEFAPKTRWVDLVEVNINNLAAVPSIVFGLLGLSVFINFMSLPRSAPMVGGLVMALMTMPTVIIASRSAITAVPPSIREAALGLGASHVQAVMHHVLPLALPGMLTGAILGLARALGETAPLLMIGMVAFIVEPPQTPLDPSSALPVQIYLWADSPERAFVERTGAAILVLLAFLLVMNASAVWLRNKYERRW